MGAKIVFCTRENACREEMCLSFPVNIGKKQQKSIFLLPFFHVALSSREKITTVIVNKPRKNNKGAAHKAAAATPKPEENTGKKRNSLGKMKPRSARWLTYLLGFLALAIFLVWGYGDMLSRAEQESFVCSSPDAMHYLLSAEWGGLFYLSRWALLLFKWAAVGGLLLAAVYTLTARLADYALCLPRQLEGLGFVIPLAQIGWMIWRGTNLYYKSEPSLFIVFAVAALLVCALAATVVWFFRRRKTYFMPQSVRPYGMVVALLLTAGTTWAARHFNENQIITARMQNLCLQGRWEDMVELGRSAKQPTRAVAAYYAIALEEQDQLLEGIFDIPFEFPSPRLDNREGGDEYAVFLADITYHAGLVNPAYRAAMDRTVMDGPRLYYLKRMALCALVNGEKELSRKYLTLIGGNPFEQDFVEKYKPMIDNEKLMLADAEIKHVLGLRPEDEHFEQNYMPPTFLGYNVGLSHGSALTLVTSAAACLYGKDLNAFLLRAEVMARKGMAFPNSMQQAIAIMALKQPDILKKFPQVGKFVPNEITSFLLDAKPLVGDRLRVRHELRDRWLGTYVYYYYTENNDPDQVRKTESEEGKVGVN